jgi:hypothetical protein
LLILFEWVIIVLIKILANKGYLQNPTRILLNIFHSYLRFLLIRISTLEVILRWYLNKILNNLCFIAYIKDMSEFLEEICRFLVTHFQLLHKTWASTPAHSQLTLRIISRGMLSSISNNFIKVAFHGMNFDLEVFMLLLCWVRTVAFTVESILMRSRGIRLLLIFYWIRTAMIIYLVINPSSHLFQSSIIEVFYFKCFNRSKS